MKSRVLASRYQMCYRISASNCNWYHLCQTIVHTADFVQDLYLKELKAYKIPPVKDSDADGQVQTFTLPQTPKSPEEADLASSLKEYESMAVEIEGQDATQTQQGAATLPDWLEAEEEEEVKH